MSNLIDSVMQEMDASNNQQDLNYSPMMMGQQQQGMMPGYSPQPHPQQMMGNHPGMMPSPIQPQRQVHTGEVSYMPRDQMGTPQHMPQHMPQAESPDTPDMEAPDLNVYGMEDEEQSMVDKVLTEIKPPLIVAILAFIMSLPQVSGFVRQAISKVTTNSIYAAALVSVLIGVLFYVINKFLN